MADVEKKKKKKKKEEVADAPAAEASRPCSRPRPRQVFDQGFNGIEEEAGSPTFGQQCLLDVQSEASGQIQGGIPADGSRQGWHPQQERSARHFRRAGSHRSREGTRRDDQ